jgi:hypothetical protein
MSLREFGLENGCAHLYHTFTTFNVIIKKFILDERYFLSSDIELDPGRYSKMLSK